MPAKTRLIFGVSGASGMPLAHAVLQSFATVKNLELHLIVSQCARLTMTCENSGANLEAFAARVHASDDLTAPCASGSWLHGGMVICPCSMSSLAAIAHGTGHNLIHRAADVCLKERRKLILAARETPLNLIHLRNMVQVTEAGAIVMPFMPAFYSGENAMPAAMRQFAGRILDMLGIEHNLCVRWGEDNDNGF